MATFMRPPYYRPPRSRPVTFEEPNSERANQTMSARQHQAVLLAHLPDHNRSPRPFKQPDQRPRIVIRELARPEAAAYPTSTVHKSMMNLPTSRRLESGPSKVSEHENCACDCHHCATAIEANQVRAEQVQHVDHQRAPIVMSTTHLPQRFKASAPSNHMLPDTKQAEFMRAKRLEQATIAHQTYRTLPIVQPKPKARHDLALGTTYMDLNQDPTYDLALESSKRSRRALVRSIERKLDAAVSGRLV